MHNKLILKKIIIVSLFLAIVKLAGAGKEMVLAYYYGTGPILDGHIYAFNLAGWPVGVFGVSLWFGLVPALVKIRNNNPGEIGLVFQKLIVITVVASTVVALMTGVILKTYIKSGATGLSEQAASAAISSVPYLGGFVWLGMLAAFYSAWLMSMQRNINTVLEGIPSLLVILVVFGWAKFWGMRLDETPINIGLLVGVAVQTMLLYLVLGRERRFGITYPRKDFNILALMQGVAVVMIAQVVMSSSMLVDTFALGQMGDGSVTSYSYAQRLMGIITTFVAFMVGRGVLPIMASVGDSASSFHLAKIWSLRMMVLGFFCSLGLLLFSEPIVAMFFERGEFAFNDTQKVSVIFEVLSLQLPFYMASSVWFSWLIVSNLSKLYLLMAVLGLIAKVMALWFLFEYETVGLAVSTIVVSVIHWLVVHLGISRIRHANN